MLYTKELKLLKADVFMTGSDQVWGPLFKVKYDPTYFLDFTDSTSKKYRMPPALDIQSLPRYPTSIQAPYVVLYSSYCERK